MNYNNLRIIQVNERDDDDESNDYNISEYTYDPLYIKEFIDNQNGNMVDTLKITLANMGFVIINNDNTKINAQHYIIIDIKYGNNTNNFFYNSYLNIFKEVHREYQLKGIINEL